MVDVTAMTIFAINVITPSDVVVVISFGEDPNSVRTRKCGGKAPCFLCLFLFKLSSDFGRQQLDLR